MINALDLQSVSALHTHVPGYSLTRKSDKTFVGRREVESGAVDKFPVTAVMVGGQPHHM